MILTGGGESSQHIKKELISSPSLFFIPFFFVPKNGGKI